MDVGNFIHLGVKI